MGLWLICCWNRMFSPEGIGRSFEIMMCSFNCFTHCSETMHRQKDAPVRISEPLKSRTVHLQISCSLRKWAFGLGPLCCVTVETILLSTGRAVPQSAWFLTALLDGKGPSQATSRKAGRESLQGYAIKGSWEKAVLQRKFGSHVRFSLGELNLWCMGWLLI